MAGVFLKTRRRQCCGIKRRPQKALFNLSVTLDIFTKKGKVCRRTTSRHCDGVTRFQSKALDIGTKQLGNHARESLGRSLGLQGGNSVVVGGTRVAFLHARTPTHSPPDVKTGSGTPRSLYTLLHLCMSLFCLLRVLLFALGEY